jgi:hypothetical protein
MERSSPTSISIHLVSTKEEESPIENKRRDKEKLSKKKNGASTKNRKHEAEKSKAKAEEKVVVEREAEKKASVTHYFGHPNDPLTTCVHVP